MAEKCAFCKKNKNVVLECTCGLKFCLKHYAPNTHNCTQICNKDKGSLELTKEATGAFSKIEKI